MGSGVQAGGQIQALFHPSYHQVKKTETFFL
jgi:hypothetical protein